MQTIALIFIALVIVWVLMKLKSLILFAAAAGIAIAFAVLFILPTTTPQNSKVTERVIVENNIANLVDDLPTSEFKQDASVQLRNMLAGRPVSREFLLDVAALLGLDIDPSITTADLLDLLVNQYEYYFD